jgi:hypothetical protein
MALKRCLRLNPYLISAIGKKSVISKKLYILLLLFAISLIILQLTSGIWLFIEKYGLSPSEIYMYFAGNEEKFIMAKSFEGLIETAVPHFLAISTIIFVYGHFLLFTKVISEKKKQLLILGLFISASIDIFSPFLIIQGYEIFAWFKIIAFWSFEILMSILLYVLLSLSIKKVLLY